MIYLFTGLPRNGKTLNLIKFACENEQFKDRQVYYYGLDGCTIDSWIELTREQLEDWHNFLPDNSILFVDECQKIWRAGTSNNRLPAHLVELEEHGHKGIDILCTAQSTKQLHVMFKELVQMHRHIVRIHGTESYNSWEYTGAKANPIAKSQVAEAQKSSGFFDKSYYGKYKSASTHNIKASFPKKPFVITGLAVLALSVVSWYLPSVFGVGDDVAVDVESVPQVSVDQASDVGRTFSPFGSRSNKDDVEFNTEFILKQLTPVILNRPDTAPVYSDLWDAKDYPRSQCVSRSPDNGGLCRCYSQQATRMNVDQQTCNYIMANGREFDHRVAPTVNNERFSLGLGGAQQRLGGLNRDDVSNSRSSFTSPQRSNSVRSLASRLQGNTFFSGEPRPTRR